MQTNSTLLAAALELTRPWTLHVFLSQVLIEQQGLSIDWKAIFSQGWVLNLQSHLTVILQGFDINSVLNTTGNHSMMPRTQPKVWWLKSTIFNVPRASPPLFHLEGSNPDMFGRPNWGALVPPNLVPSKIKDSCWDLQTNRKNMEACLRQFRTKWCRCWSKTVNPIKSHSVRSQFMHKAWTPCHNAKSEGIHWATIACKAEDPIPRIFW